MQPTGKNETEFKSGLRGKHRIVEQRGQWTVREFVRPWGTTVFEVTAPKAVLGAFATLDEALRGIADHDAGG